MFAFAIWERDTQRLFIARDRLGVKPLYLSRTGQRLRFASALPALLKGGDINPILDPVALNHYLNFHAVVPAPRTLLAGIESCRRRPGCVSKPMAAPSRKPGGPCPTAHTPMR
jgi:asparagine synthase (glutamine-hydrolysing)